MSDRADLGKKLKRLRKARDWTLAQLSEATSVPLSSLSKIENNQLSPTYDQLLKISSGFGLDIAELLSDNHEAEPPRVIGRRSINRLGEGTHIVDPAQHLRYLSTDLLDKSFCPIIAEHFARSIEEYGEMTRHPGEEFLYVIEGAVEFHSELYAPVRLEAGESIYFDSSMGHAYIKAADGPCRTLSICSSPRRDPAPQGAAETKPKAAQPPARSRSRVL